LVFNILNKQLQENLLASFSLAEQASASLTHFVDQLADEKKYFESVSADTVGSMAGSIIS